MKNNILIIFAISGLVFFAACEKTVYFDVETKENRLVVNSFLQPDSTNRAVVSLSVDPLAIGFESERVSDATIAISKNGAFIGNFTHEFNGDYYIENDLLHAEPNDEFELTVSAPGKETVTASTKIPSLIPITSAAIIDTFLIPISYSSIDPYGNVIYIDTLVPYFKMAITFTDPGTEDFYSLGVMYRDIFNQSFACVSTNDPIFTVSGEYNFGAENQAGAATFCDEVMFTDVTFNGTTKTVELNIYAINTLGIADPRFEFSLKHVSKEYFQYYTTTEKQLENEGNPFGEPVIIYSNIENGFGIFAGNTISKAIIEL